MHVGISDPMYQGFLEILTGSTVVNRSGHGRLNDIHVFSC